jgi:hypothetical protein
VLDEKNVRPLKARSPFSIAKGALPPMLFPETINSPVADLFSGSAKATIEEVTKTANIRQQATILRKQTSLLFSFIF